MLDKFKFSIPVALRWSDLDALKHVNNARFLTFFEEARIAYFRNIGWDWQKDGLIIARNEINYRKPVFLADEPVIHLRCARIGSKSFDIEYLMLDKLGNPLADGKTVLVVFDYQLDHAVVLPDATKQKLLDFDGPNIVTA
jgi:acyl-CoA thioester hydrolase